MGPGEIRRHRARNQAYRLLRPIKNFGIDCVIQCGLGDWAEGPVLLDLFPNAAYMAVEPIHRYCHETWAAGFRGPIIQGLLWNETGLKKELNDWRTRTSVHDGESHGLGTIEAHTITLDDASKFIKFPLGNTLLWMDTEGSELTILEGAEDTLTWATAIVCELKVGTKFPGWPTREVVVEKIESLGFLLTREIRSNGLFVRDVVQE